MSRRHRERHRTERIGWLRATVADGGPGFDRGVVGAEGHLGLAGIREQAELLGGTFDVSSDAGNGTEVTVRWPM